MRIVIPLLFICLASSCQNSTEVKFEQFTGQYPQTQKEDVKDEYFGTTVQDPYRWLENDTSKATGRWVQDQNAVTFDYLEKIPFRKKIQDRLTALWNYEKYSAPFKEGKYYYYEKNDGLQDQWIFYQQEGLDGASKVFLDPNKFSDDGTVALGAYSFSKSGAYFAYQKTESGSDWRTIYVKNAETGEALSDVVKWVKFSGISWFKDGFFYGRYPTDESGAKYSTKNENHQLYYHKLGTDQKDDILIHKDDAHPQRNFYCETSDDERFLMIYGSESTSGNALGLIELKNGINTPIKWIVPTFDYDYNFVDNIEDDLLIMTNYKAPKWRLISTNKNNVSESNWTEIIPEAAEVLDHTVVVGGKLVSHYIKHASSQLLMRNLDGKGITEIVLPEAGTIGAMNGKKESDFLFYTFRSYLRPNSVFKLNLKTKQNEVYKEPSIPFDKNQYVSYQLKYKSKDGTEIPIFITHRKDLKKDGSNPTLLYGYGGFNISILPGYSIPASVIIENGGIYAVANIRGGGEYGREWHKAGTKMQKQNVFDDFIAAAEMLIDQGFTSADKLAISGRSNGGLLVGACMTQRPELFKVAFPGVGVLDMLRYHKFTIGWAWATDYGTSEESEVMFNYLLNYSPVHNVKKGTHYPATMVTTADHDDRVVPAHSFKFISELQDKHEGPNPVLIRIEEKAGHGAGTPTSKQIEQAADWLSFMFYNMETPVKIDN